MMPLTHEESVGLMRALMRSLEKTPERERELHKALFDKVSQHAVETLPPGVAARVARAMDHAIGR